MLLCYSLGEGSFSKSYVDRERSDKMFCSLTVILPSPHEGGALLVRHSGKEWTFDSGKELAAAKNNLTIGYVALFPEIEREVAQVTSGHRITLTYHLYFDDGPVSPDDAASDPVHFTKRPMNNDAFRNALATQLEDPEFLADGGTLAFGLTHVYPRKGSLEDVYGVLKGSDAVVYEGALHFGFEPVLYLYYKTDYSRGRGVMIDRALTFSWVEFLTESEGLLEVVKDEGGIPVCREGDEIEEDDELGAPEYVEWVSPKTTINARVDAFVSSRGGDDELEWGSGDLCLVVRIGKAGHRLAYPTRAQLNRALRW